MSRRVFMPCGVTEPHPAHTAGPGFGTFRCPGVEATTNAGPVPIRLPPEPPRDRVIEAVDEGGKVQMSWTWDSEREYWCSGIYPYGFDDVVASGIENRCLGWSLRHVPAEGGET